MPRKHNIVEKLNEIAQQATEWLNKFGIGGEVKVVEGEEREREGEKRLFWGWGAWEKPDFIFIHSGVEIGAFVRKYRAIRASMGCGELVEAKLFGKACYLGRYEILLPFPIDFAMSFYPYFISFVRKDLVDRLFSHFDYETQPPTIVVQGEKGDMKFKISVENIDRARLEINQQEVLAGNVVEVFRQFNHLIALSNL
jgi:hypothetical protein